MSPLAIAAGIALLAWAIRCVWRMEPKGLRAADIEALAWWQPCEPAPRDGGSGHRAPKPILARWSARGLAGLAQSN